MATITKRINKDGSFGYFTRLKPDLSGKRKAATFPTKALAEQWATENEYKLVQKKHRLITEDDAPAASKTTLSDAINDFLDTIASSYSKKRQRQCTNQLNWWRSAPIKINDTLIRLGDMLLKDVTSVELIQAREVLQKRDRLALHYSPAPTKPPRRKLIPKPEPRCVSPATINRYTADLSKLFTWGQASRKWGLTTNPVSLMGRLEEPKGRERYLKLEEYPRLLEALKGSTSPYVYKIFFLTVAVGSRDMEIRGLRWKDVDLNLGVIYLIDTKDDKRRAVPLHKEALALLKDHAKVRYLDTDLVFPSKNHKKPIDIRTPWRTALRKAKIDDFRFHDLRHTTGSYMAILDINAKKIANTLGHADIRTTERYMNLQAEDTRKPLQDVADYLSSGGQSRVTSQDTEGPKGHLMKVLESLTESELAALVHTHLTPKLQIQQTR